MPEFGDNSTVFDYIEEQKLRPHWWPGDTIRYFKVSVEISPKPGVEPRVHISAKVGHRRIFKCYVITFILMAFSLITAYFMGNPMSNSWYSFYFVMNLYIFGLDRSYPNWHKAYSYNCADGQLYSENGRAKFVNIRTFRKRIAEILGNGELDNDSWVERQEQEPMLRAKMVIPKIKRFPKLHGSMLSIQTMKMRIPVNFRRGQHGP